MDFIKNAEEIPLIIKGYAKKMKLKGADLALYLGKDPGYLSRVLNGKSELSLEIMFKLLRHMGYEVVIMSKKERNLLEKGAYAELSRELPAIREEIREGVVEEIGEDIIKSLRARLRSSLASKTGKSS